MSEPVSQARWFPGRWLALVWDSGAALIDAKLGLASAEGIWRRVRAESTLAVFLQSMVESSGTDFLALPDFAVAVAKDERWQLAVRGQIPVLASCADDVQQLSSDGIATWAERTVAAQHMVLLGVEEAPGAPIADGVLWAGGIKLTAPAKPSTLEDTEHDDSLTVVRPALTDPVDPSDQPKPGYSPYDYTDRSAFPDFPPLPIPEPGPQPPKYLTDENDPYALSQQTNWSGEPPGLPQPKPSTVQGNPDSLEMLLARMCQREHPNPPERLNCFVCGAEVSGQARRVPRPQLGWLHIEGMDPIALTGPLLVGRAPREGVVKLAEPPKLIELPFTHVSGTHLAVLIQGWQLQVQDLRSRNGTVLCRPDSPPSRLAESRVLVRSGDALDLGRGVLLRFEGTP